MPQLEAPQSRKYEREQVSSPVEIISIPDAGETCKTNLINKKMSLAEIAEGARNLNPN